ncbi:putative sulfate exporter family transporter [Sphingobacterium paramultivorum]|uniref:Putative sulfate exporter family transporter n=1 Tax=Sphingobacterium paramultivorum TaxID=2886510 RepID=A0A7G5DWY8_9SPHI|nr:putative sulfate exporter family transporter [Sphingobacterium paramultivorum]QMV66263.1 putative sulfate exporter family transporter [Sphingobacterium paramultivorum]WSO15042.1 putative sulfate exporter family transporter [Sphingobacterium paramultivorum]
MSSSKSRAIISEDWTVVILGLALIFSALFGIIVPSPSFSWNSAADLSAKVLSPENLLAIGVQFLLVFVTALVGAVLLRKPLKSLLVVFPFIFVLTILALVLAGNSTVKEYNLEAVIFSLGIGLLISNLFKLPSWFKEALSTELYVKIGLVLLGTTVIFGEILKAGTLGLIQALVVVLSVWYFAFWLCRKLKVDQEMALMLSSAVSICGVSAAIATSGAIKGDPKKLSYVVSLVLITAIPMMILMPYFAAWMGLSQEVTGAWLGGSIDTTGAVVASGSLVGEEALKISTIVKFSQNVLLGIAAFAISVYWTYSHSKSAENAEKPTLKIIWERFPKFVLGFVFASLLFSFVINAEQINSVKAELKSIQGLWFALAFTSIGLETNFKELFVHNNKKPLYAFLIAQTFNIMLTLVIAILLFR